MDTPTAKGHNRHRPPMVVILPSHILYWSHASTRPLPALGQHKLVPPTLPISPPFVRPVPPQGGGGSHEVTVPPRGGGGGLAQGLGI